MTKRNGYEFGKEFEYDELRAGHNLSEILAGKYKRKEKKKKRRFL